MPKEPVVGQPLHPHGGHKMSSTSRPLGPGGHESYPDLFQPFGGFPDGVKVEKAT